LEIEKHLLEDGTPSIYLGERLRTGDFDKKPFDVFHKMSKTMQSPKFHPEGDVFTHTMMVADQAARVRDNSGEPRALMWAALLHDMGKPATAAVKNGRHTAYNHDRVGAGMAHRFIMSFTDDRALADKVSALVRYHMQILFVIKSMPYARTSRMKQEVDFREIALLGYCDRMGRGNADERLERENIRIFIEKLENL